MWTNILLFVLLIICVVTDLRERKIYNKILLPVIIIAIFYHLFTSGISGLVASILGCLVGLFILLIPYLMGGMGAGDVKLLAVIGAIKGTSFVLMTSLNMAIVGAVIGLCILLFRKGFIARIKNVLYLLMFKGQFGEGSLLFDKEGLKTTYPYGVAIAMGAIGAMLNVTGGLF
jgi:prepilin peptidase CpaA